MLISSSVRMWLGSVTLSGLLLVSSLPVLAATQTARIQLIMKPTRVASTMVPTGTYTEAVRKQMQWNAGPVSTNKGLLRWRSGFQPKVAQLQRLCSPCNNATAEKQPL